MTVVVYTIVDSASRFSVSSKYRLPQNAKDFQNRSYSTKNVRNYTAYYYGKPRQNIIGLLHNYVDNYLCYNALFIVLVLAAYSPFYFIHFRSEAAHPVPQENNIKYQSK